MTKTLQLLNRNGWLAAWLRKRRRARQNRLLPAPVLRAAYPTLLQWDWNLANPYKWNIWTSLDGGVSYFLTEDYWHYGDSRQFAPDGGSEFYLIVGVDATGKEITHRSNAVRPDDAIAPPEIVAGGFEWDATETGFADVWVDWTFNHAGHPVALIEFWARTGPDFALVATVGSDAPGYYYASACETETTFEIKVRYRNGATVGPFSNVYVVDVQV
ncbi:MAG TPA: hypothetical protein VI136_22255 [Verrucomicrobiae bacterium]